MLRILRIAYSEKITAREKKHSLQITCDAHVMGEPYVVSHLQNTAIAINNSFTDKYASQFSETDCVLSGLKFSFTSLIWAIFFRVGMCAKEIYKYASLILFCFE